MELCKLQQLWPLHLAVSIPYAQSFPPVPFAAWFPKLPPHLEHKPHPLSSCNPIVQLWAVE